MVFEIQLVDHSLITVRKRNVSTSTSCELRNCVLGGSKEGSRALEERRETDELFMD